MHIANKNGEKLVKGIALMFGILCGCFYATYNRSDSRQEWIHLRSPHGRTNTLKPQRNIVNETTAFLVLDDTSIADNLAKSIKILCWIHVKTAVKDRIDAIKNTWGRKCTTFITITNTGETSYADNIVHISNSGNTFSNIGSSYRFIYEHYGNEFDWFLKTDDRVFVVMENLRYKLYAYNASEPIGIGLKKISSKGQEYLSEKAGYVLSKNAIKKLSSGFNKELKCLQNDENNENTTHSNEEVRVGRCLNEVGVILKNSTDIYGKQQFFDKYLDDFLLPNPEVKLPYPWYEKYNVNHNLNSISNYSITFCDLQWRQMFVMEYLIYQLRPYELDTETPSLPKKISLL